MFAYKDESIRIGPDSYSKDSYSKDSYLKIQILQEANVIHPGVVRENAWFAPKDTSKY